MTYKEFSAFCLQEHITLTTISEDIGYERSFISQKSLRECSIPEDILPLFMTALDFEIKRNKERNDFIKEQLKRKQEILLKRNDISNNQYYDKIMKDIEHYSLLNEYAY